MNFKERYQKSNDTLTLTEKKKEELIRRLSEAEREGEARSKERGQDGEVILVSVESVKRKGRLKKAGIAAAALLLFISGATVGARLYRGQSEAAPGGRTSPAAQTPPAVQTPDMAAKEDTPEAFLGSFIPEQADDRTMYSITYGGLLSYLEARADEQTLEEVAGYAEAEGNDSLNFVKRDQFYQTAYQDESGERVKVTAIVLNGTAASWCLLFREEERWEFYRIFRCAEIEEAGNFGTEQIAVSDKETVTLLSLKGRLDHGAGYFIHETQWYDLTSGHPSLFYLSDSYHDHPSDGISGTDIPIYGFSVEKQDVTPRVNGGLDLTYRLRFYSGQGDMTGNGGISIEKTVHFEWNAQNRRYEGKEPAALSLAGYQESRMGDNSLDSLNSAVLTFQEMAELIGYDELNRMAGQSGEEGKIARSILEQTEADAGGADSDTFRKSPFSNVNTLEKVTMTVEKEIYEENTEEFELLLTNDRECEFTYGNDVALEVYRGNEWYEVALREPKAWKDLGYVLKAGQNAERTERLVPEAPLESGKYRILKVVFMENSCRGRGDRPEESGGSAGEGNDKYILAAEFRITQK